MSLVAVPMITLYAVGLGLTGYLLYTYASYAFMTAFNELYLVYVALLGLTLYTFVVGMVRLDAAGLKRAIGERSVRSYVAFQLLVAVMIVVLWLAEILPATLTGTTPPSIAEANLPVNVIYSLDLGVLVPAFVLSAYWLRKRQPAKTSYGWRAGVNDRDDDDKNRHNDGRQVLAFSG